MTEKNRNIKAKRNIVIISVIAFFAVAYLIFYKQVTELRLNNFGIETTGKITDIDVDNFSDPASFRTGEGSIFKTINYEFNIDGKKYRGISTNPHLENGGYIPLRSLNVGDSVTIKYLKNNPKINKMDYSIIYNIEFGNN